MRDELSNDTGNLSNGQPPPPANRTPKWNNETYGIFMGNFHVPFGGDSGRDGQRYPRMGCSES